MCDSSFSTPSSGWNSSKETSKRKYKHHLPLWYFLQLLSYYTTTPRRCACSSPSREKRNEKKRGHSLHTHTHTHRVSNIHIYNPETNLTASQWVTGVFRSPISLLFIYFFPHLFSVRLHIYKGCETRRGKRRRRKNCSSNSSRVWARLECIPS